MHLPWPDGEPLALTTRQPPAVRGPVFGRARRRHHHRGKGLARDHDLPARRRRRCGQDRGGRGRSPGQSRLANWAETTSRQSARPARRQGATSSLRTAPAAGVGRSGSTSSSPWSRSSWPGLGGWREALSSPPTPSLSCRAAGAPRCRGARVAPVVDHLGEGCELSNMKRGRSVARPKGRGQCLSPRGLSGAGLRSLSRGRCG